MRQKRVHARLRRYGERHRVLGMQSPAYIAVSAASRGLAMLLRHWYLAEVVMARACST